jgi:small subunit ribosomal protein S15
VIFNAFNLSYKPESFKDEQNYLSLRFETQTDRKTNITFKDAMKLTTEAKQEIFEKHSLGKSKADTGSAESQIALFTTRINHLTEHLKENKKDYSTRLGLLKLVGKRRRLLNYLTKQDIGRYRSIIAELGIRK